MFPGYDYSCNILFVYDYMVISHKCWFDSNEFYDVEDPIVEDNAIAIARNTLLNQYGIDVIAMNPIELLVEWEEYPTEEYVHLKTNENGD